MTWGKLKFHTHGEPLFLYAVIGVRFQRRLSGLHFGLDQLAIRCKGLDLEPEVAIALVLRGGLERNCVGIDEELDLQVSFRGRR